MFTIDPIGTFHTIATALYDVPRQPALQPGNHGVIRLKPGYQFEQALEGLEKFDRIWVIFRFHKHDHWKPKVLPPRGGKKQGVFATRSPHRPNFIGMSCVQLQAIKGLELFVINHDLIDETPILDIKPYLNYADSFESDKQGWLDDLPQDTPISIGWSLFAQKQLDYLATVWNLCLKEGIEHRLQQSSLPYPNNRVKEIEEGKYELAYRTWRIIYSRNNGIVKISHLKSGYDAETLRGEKPSRWDDVPIHQALITVVRNGVTPNSD